MCKPTHNYGHTFYLVFTLGVKNILCEITGYDYLITNVLFLTVNHLLLTLLIAKHLTVIVACAKVLAPWPKILEYNINC